MRRCVCIRNKQFTFEATYTKRTGLTVPCRGVFVLVVMVISKAGDVHTCSESGVAVC